MVIKSELSMKSVILNHRNIFSFLLCPVFLIFCISENCLYPPTCCFAYFYSHPILYCLSHVYDEVSQYFDSSTILVKIVELDTLFKNDKSNAKTVLNSSVPADILTF